MPDYANGDYIYAAQHLSMKRAIAGNAIISGMGVTENAPPDMDVIVAAGVYYASGTRKTYAGGTITINAADPADDRWDIISAGLTGLTYSAGTPGVVSAIPNLPTVGDILIAAILVPAADVSIEQIQIYTFGFDNILLEHMSRHLPGGADALTVGVPSDIGAANAEGSAAAFARQDHVHNHPSGLNENLHHNKVHTHVSAAEGGTILHADTIGKTENDHHNRVHLLSSSGDHSGTLNANQLTPGTTEQVIKTIGGVGVWGTPKQFPTGSMIIVATLPVNMVPNVVTAGAPTVYQCTSTGYVTAGYLYGGVNDTDYPNITGMTRKVRWKASAWVTTYPGATATLKALTKEKATTSYGAPVMLVGDWVAWGSGALNGDLEMKISAGAARCGGCVIEIGYEVNA